MLRNPRAGSPNPRLQRTRAMRSPLSRQPLGAIYSYRGTRSRSGEAGFTLTDLIVIIVGVGIAVWIGGYLHVGSGPLVPVLSCLFGLAFWFVVFALVDPLVERVWKSLRGDHDNVA